MRSKKADEQTERRISNTARISQPIRVALSDLINREMSQANKSSTAPRSNGRPVNLDYLQVSWINQNNGAGDRAARRPPANPYLPAQASQMDNIKATTEQLRVEAQISRKKVSEVSKDLMEFCEKNKQQDMLVSGPGDQHNPFQEKKSCSML
ncbi:unnamed protein product [Caenorhabditis auriculariae]|uniref:Guanine nucleotide-binding protein subunit gamma n=1 Tax=Caenorhabditis auriculariae TaxID=2777116 RepID=A0A8S1HDH5_9PELO|nr:unnamed protein product [Caenorhabditis auriculariae]